MRRRRREEAAFHGWVTDDQLHCGYLVAEFADGATSGLLNPALEQVMATTVQERSHEGTRVQYTPRPDGLVIGWQVRCDCYVRLLDDKGWPPVQWHSGRVFTRVPSRELDDPADGRLFAPDGASINGVVGRAEVDAVAQQVWQEQHLDQFGVLDQLRTAVSDEAAARARAAGLAQAARSTGATWEQVGAAAGITRQSAQQRWGRK